MKGPKPFKDDDIIEISVKDTIENAGKVKTWKQRKWKRLKATEKAKARPYIAGLVVIFWVIFNIVGVIRFIALGDITLLIYSPTSAIIPLLAYYFTSEGD